MKKRVLRWLALSLFCTGFIPQNLRAADPVPAPSASVPAPAAVVQSTNVSLSVPPPATRAPWQQRLTLGPGDTLNFSLYLEDKPEQVRENVVIGPDGRVSYLQAQDVMASGLTIEELRAKFNAELGKFYRSPRTIITPGQIRSKKYFVLGSVVNKGVYAFDRPLTLIEALARAGGLETGIFERNTIELADLSRSFVVRQGQKVPVDFEKLFEQGDLSQNIPLEPDDYLYFASSTANEIYVFGSVAQPGTMPYTPNAGALAAISRRGGFGPKSWKSRVLVIRGSLNHPETFAVNTHDILNGRAPDFRLKPRDIVYVADRPWAKVEELLDTGTRAFIEGLIVTYTGSKIGPFIDPLIH